MNTNQKTARIVGVLFVIVMVTWFLGMVLVEPVITVPDYLLNISLHESRVMIGVLLELIEVAGVVAIIFMMFPILKQQNERLALGYTAFRILECTMLIAAALCALLLITLSHEYASAGAADAAYYQTLGALTMAVRGEWSTLILAIFYGLGGLIFFYLLYQAALIPRWISIIGLVGATLVTAGTVLAFLGIDVRMFFGLRMGLIEVFLGVWLIVKGFNASAIASAPTRVALSES